MKSWSSKTILSVGWGVECGVGKSNRKGKLSGVGAMMWYWDPLSCQRTYFPLLWEIVLVPYRECLDKENHLAQGHAHFLRSSYPITDQLSIQRHSPLAPNRGTWEGAFFFRIPHRAGWHWQCIAAYFLPLTDPASFPSFPQYWSQRAP